MMNKMISLGYVIATPFNRQAITHQKSGDSSMSIVYSANKLTITWLDVLCPCEGNTPHSMNAAPKIKPGCQIGVMGNDYVQGWAKTEFELDGVKYIMVPFDSIRMIKTND
jgi:hypothetical protein